MSTAQRTACMSEVALTQSKLHVCVLCSMCVLARARVKTETQFNGHVNYAFFRIEDFLSSFDFMTEWSLMFGFNFISFSAFAVYYPLTACMCDDGEDGRQYWWLEEQTHYTHDGQWRVTCAWIFAIDQMAQLVTVVCPTALVQRTKTKQQQNERNGKHKQATHRLIELIATLVKYAPVRSFLMDKFDWVKWLCEFFLLLLYFTIHNKWKHFAIWTRFQNVSHRKEMSKKKRNNKMK